ncbi:riboflavin biosynthesis protein RibF [Granulicella sp. dw_53]|uniref:riboflavin biosynthesis protein RibF n=1 Tax=Granulicella sp. dw_53 TaxID=2719792 RepID=UPI001BD53258|nr:riboflavin biosynthesis protein RibF [Granulicella sp. dw_53]
MNIYRELSSLPRTLSASVATIGNFDGVHRGHQGVIAEVVARARQLDHTSLAVTFDPHPARVLRPDASHSLITPLPQKLELLAATGIENVAVLPFTPEFSKLTARAFASDLLRDTLHIQELHEGENFRFGYQAEAGIDSLEALGKELGFTVRVYSPRLLRGGPISSSRVRNAIASGNVSEARALLGRPFAIESHPASGRGYGTRYTVPTINLAPYPELLPANGVYVTALTVGTGPSAETFDAVTNVGNRPTFGADSFTVESHLLNFHPIDLDQDTPLKLSFLKRLRPEIRWPSTEALREQIGRDVRQANRFFNLCRLLTPPPRSASTPETLQES